jgi:hypothetical protein
MVIYPSGSRYRVDGKVEFEINLLSKISDSKNCTVSDQRRARSLSHFAPISKKKGTLEYNKTAASDDIATTIVRWLLLAVVQQKNEEGEEGILKFFCFPPSIIFLYFNCT